MSNDWATKVSRNYDRYEQLKQLKQRARQREAEYSQAAVENVTTPVRGFIDEAAAQGKKISKGGGQIGQGIYDLTQGDYLEGLKYTGAGGLNVAAGIANAALSPVTGAVSSVVPDLGVMDYLIENYGDNPQVQKVVQLAKENPMAAEALLNTLDIAGMKGAGRALGRSVNAIAENTTTKVPGFYDSPSPVNKAVSAAKVALPNSLYAFKQGFNPTAAAERRVIGTGQGRRNEYVTAASEDLNLARGNAEASAFMNAQINNMTGPNRNTVVGNTSEVARYIEDWFDLADKSRLAKNLNPEGDVPDAVVKGAVNHIVNGPHNLSSKAGDTSVVVRKTTAGEGLAGEAVGVASTSAPTLSALKSGPTINKAKAALKDVSPEDFYRQYLSAAKHANPFNIRKAAKSGELPETFGKGSVNKMKLLQDYWGIVLKQKSGKTLTENQKKIYEFFDKAPKVKLTNRGDGIYSLSDSHASSAQDLGGVNDWIAIDTKNDKVYSMISDGHDMFGMDPAGGNSLVNVLPIQQFDVGKTKKFSSGGKTGSRDLSKIEELTGIKRNKGESDTAYQARVMKDYRGKAELQDYLTVGKNIAGAGMLASQFNTNKEENQQ